MLKGYGPPVCLHDQFFDEGLANGAEPKADVVAGSTPTTPSQYAF